LIAFWIRILKVCDNPVDIFDPFQAAEVLLSFETLKQTHNMLHVLVDRELFSSAVIKYRAEQPFTLGYGGYMACASSKPLHLSRCQENFNQRQSPNLR
jgi:hypothetical protein